MTVDERDRGEGRCEHLPGSDGEVGEDRIPAEVDFEHAEIGRRVRDAGENLSQPATQRNAMRSTAAGTSAWPMTPTLNRDD